MREIKFRAWDTVEEKVHIVDSINFSHKRIFEVPHPDIPINNYELMQYTGLKDKNGKEIYEGDIVKVIEHGPHPFCKDLDYHSIYGPIYKAKICWSNESVGFRSEFKWPDGVIDNHIGIIPQETEVIGNIYENPELLERGDEIPA